MPNMFKNNLKFKAPKMGAFFFAKVTSVMAVNDKANCIPDAFFYMIIPGGSR